MRRNVSKPLNQEAENALMEHLFAFPEVTFEQFLRLPERMRREIVERNRVINTDTYNRTMAHVKGKEDAKKQETYVLQLRRAAEGYLIACGVREAIEKVTNLPITKAEVDFAADYYEHYGNVPFFNRDMWMSVVHNGGKLPLEIDAVPDGTAIRAGDPVLRVSGPGELAAHFEPQMHRVFYQTLVATTAREIAEKVGAHRFIEVGKRGTPNEDMHLQAAVAMYVGGGISYTSNDAAAACYPQLKDVGTLGHRFIQFYETEDEAFRKAVEKTDATSLLIDLVDSYKGIDKALELKQEFRDSGKKIWIRLDSGDITEQTIHTLKKFKELGFDDPTLDKVVVEDISTVDDMVKIDEAVRAAGLDPDKHVIYGAGGLLVTKMKERSNASSGYKLARVGEGESAQDKMKFSDSPGKESLPGHATLAIKDGQRTIVTEEEAARGGYQSLMVPAYRDGEVLLSDNLDEARVRANLSYAQLRAECPEGFTANERTPLSPGVQAAVQTLRAHYGALKESVA